MNVKTNNIGDERRQIRQLDETAINRIAAGEVVERPASAVKELIENAIDADATQIDISYANGGMSFVEVSDDGTGIPVSELPLALSRHATSKIDGTDLLNIHTFGFRGEALPSLGAIARMSIETRHWADDSGFSLTVEGGVMAAPRPASRVRGTSVRVADIFYATPARLKFLKSERAEAQAISDVVKRLSMAAPRVAFTLTDRTDKRRKLLDFPAEAGTEEMVVAGRLGRVMGRDFTQNAIWIDATRDGLRLFGMAGVPTFSKGAAVAQYLFVNGRPVKDRMLTGALRGAYMDVMSRDRHPVVALFVECAPDLVDVNVHPAKSEVRFKDAGIARGLIVSGIKHALAEAGHRSSTTVSGATLGAFEVEREFKPIYQVDTRRDTHASMAPFPGFAEAELTSARVEEPLSDGSGEGEEARPLGAARAQLHENYIVAQTDDGMIIVDQHAAHERLVYEELKARIGARDVPTQILLIPEIIELSEYQIASLMDLQTELASMGFDIDRFGGNAICVRSTPAILGDINAGALVQDILDELESSGMTVAMEQRINAILSRVSCHGSIRSGRRMTGMEMNALLRQMEEEPMSGQCNHGRPTYVKLHLSDIERLFGRT